MRRLAATLAGTVLAERLEPAAQPLLELCGDDAALRGLDGPHLRVALREILSNERRDMPTSEEISRPLEVTDGGRNGTESSRSVM